MSTRAVLVAALLVIAAFAGGGYLVLRPAAVLERGERSRGNPSPDGEPAAERSDDQNASAGELPEWDAPTTDRQSGARSGAQSMARGPLAIRDEIFALPQDASSAETIRKLLRELAAIGSTQAVGVVLEVVTSADIWFHDKARFLAELLDGIDDERVVPALIQGIGVAVEQKRDSWLTFAGYLDIIATRGGAEAGAFLVELLESDYGSLARASAERLSLIQEHVDVERVFALADSDPARAVPALVSLTRFRDPLVRSRAFDHAFEADLVVGKRCELYRTIGESLAEDSLERFFDPPSVLDPSVAKRVVIAGVRGLSRNPTLDVATRVEVAEPLLIGALGDEDRDVRRAAIIAIAEDAEYRADQVIARLQDVLDKATDSEERVTVRRLLKEIRGEQER